MLSSGKQLRAKKLKYIASVSKAQAVLGIIAKESEKRVETLWISWEKRNYIADRRHSLQNLVFDLSTLSACIDHTVATTYRERSSGLQRIHRGMISEWWREWKEWRRTRLPPYLMNTPTAVSELMNAEITSKKTGCATSFLWINKQAYRWPISFLPICVTDRVTRVHVWSRGLPSSIENWNVRLPSNLYTHLDPTDVKLGNIQSTFFQHPSMQLFLRMASGAVRTSTAQFQSIRHYQGWRGVMWLRFTVFYQWNVGIWWITFRFLV